MAAPVKQSEPISGLPNPTVCITGHDASSGKGIIQERRDGNWTVYDDKLMAFNVVYTTSEFPVSLNGDADIKKHDDLLASNKLGLANKNGTVCRIVDFAPGYECIMHRTQSLDYGVCLEGPIELVMDSGDVQLMKRSDVAVQRGTMHSWRNPSTSSWARMLFVLQDSQKTVVDGQALGEDLGHGVEGLPTSGNDA